MPKQHCYFPDLQQQRRIRHGCRISAGVHCWAAFSGVCHPGARRRVLLQKRIHQHAVDTPANRTTAQPSQQRRGFSVYSTRRTARSGGFASEAESTVDGSTSYIVFREIGTLCGPAQERTENANTTSSTVRRRNCDAGWRLSCELCICYSQ